MRNVRAPSAPRIIKLPASILSGIVVYVFPRAERSFPPFMVMVVVPAPLIFAPHRTSKSATSLISPTAPSLRNPSRKKSIGRSPITHPPGCGNETSPNRASRGPERTIDERIRFEISDDRSVFVSFPHVNMYVWEFLFFTPHPSSPRRSLILFTSSMLGIFCTVNVSLKRMEDAITLRAAFFAPLTAMVPVSFLLPPSPRMRNLSFAIGEYHKGFCSFLQTQP